MSIGGRFDKLSALQRGLISASCGFVAYGAWAALVNIMHGQLAAFKAACVQGSYSFMLTLCMTFCIEGIYRLVVFWFRSTYIAIFLTVSVVCVCLYVTSWWVNAMAGTPEIFNTVILGYVVGTVYTVSYVLGLARARS